MRLRLTFMGFTSLLLLIPLIGWSDPVKIGVISSLDPEAAAWSLSANLGLKQAAKEINDEGKLQLELLFEDDQFKPKNAVSAYQKLKNIDGVRLFIGPQFDHTLAPILRLANEERNIVITTIATNPRNTQPYGYVFHSAPPDRFGGVCLSRKLRVDNRRSLLFFSQEESYSMNFTKFVTDNLPTNIDYEVITYPTETTDFRQLFLRIKQRRPEALVIMFPTPAIAAKMYRQLASLGIKLPIYTNEVIHGSSELIKEAGELAKETIYPITDFDPESPAIKSFLASLPEPPLLPFYAVTAYDTLHWLKQLIVDNGTESSKLKEAIYSLNYRGLATEYKFDKFGDFPNSDWALWQVTETGFRKLQGCKELR